MSVQALPLWRQLQAAAAVLAAIRRGESATPALARVDAALRPGAQALSFHALRQLGRAEALRRQLAKRPPPPAADALLCTALALGWQEQGAPYPAFTLVDQAVEAAKRSPETKAQQAFINACLRRFLRERDALVAATDADP
ncbi:MAG TPA: transcription antitermination factor NusB, partial [Ramlibacter sp.]|nr:transcription antitermination factor NusB [Ramlibacter sp.]